jgi:hypothetical protein
LWLVSQSAAHDLGKLVLCFLQRPCRQRASRASGQTSQVQITS